MEDDENLLEYFLGESQVSEATLETARSLIAILGEPDAAQMNLTVGSSQYLMLSWYTMDKGVDALIQEDGETSFIKSVFDNDGDSEEDAMGETPLSLLEWLGDGGGEADEVV